MNLNLKIAFSTANSNKHYLQVKNNSKNKINYNRHPTNLLKSILRLESYLTSLK